MSSTIMGVNMAIEANGVFDKVDEIEDIQEL